MKLEIVTPEKLVYSENVEMVTLPGSEGEFGVLANHSPLIAALQAGEIKIYSNVNGGAVKGSYNIAGGLAQVTADSCIVLVDSIKDAA